MTHWVVYPTGHRLHALAGSDGDFVPVTSCGRVALGAGPGNALAKAGMPRCMCCCRRNRVRPGQGVPEWEEIARMVGVAREVFR